VLVITYFSLISTARPFLTYKNIKANEEGKLTERFSKAAELLGHEELFANFPRTDHSSWANALARAIV
jgi:hypothetical protein